MSVNIPGRTCSAEACDRKHIARGLCTKHYQRLLAQGPLTPLPTSAAERLAARLVRKPNGCLEWVGAIQSMGYGEISVDAKMVGTHRLAWELVHGPIPDGLFVLHRCDNPPCAQTEPTEGFPDGHLFLGTHDDNMADMVAKGRHSNVKRSAS